jgi:hypothetical protein
VSPATLHIKRLDMNLSDSMQAADKFKMKMEEEEAESSSAPPPPPRLYRGMRFPAKQQRLSHCLTPSPGHVLPNVDRGPPIRLKGCAFNADCSACQAEPNGEMAALQRQLDECEEWAAAPRRVRFFHGGDLLSIMHPMGFQGPGSTEFCHCCHARLNQTNGKGLPSSRLRQEGFTDDRPDHIRDPPRRMGTQATRVLSQKLQEARALYAQGKGKKPSEAAYHSCINAPLFHVNTMSDEVSLIPLHIELGQGLRIFNALEASLKKVDAAYAKFCGKLPDDTKEKAALLKIIATIEKIISDLDEARMALSTHSHGLELIEATPDSSAAVEKAKKPPGGEELLPLEAEYRAHLVGLMEAKSKVTALEKQLDTEEKKADNQRAEQPGEREMALLQLMATLKLKREAYHGGAFVGSDIQAVMDPEIIAKFCGLLADIKVGAKLKLDADRRVRLNLKTFGSVERSDEMKELFMSFSDVMTLFGRTSALCEHHIRAFQPRCDRYARAYATALPDEQSQPKTHLLCAEMADQAERMGGPGMLGEDPVESVHVRDNGLKRRHASTTDRLENLRLRAVAFDRLADTRNANICKVEEQAGVRKRQKIAEASRKRKNHARVEQ